MITIYPRPGLGLFALCLTLAAGHVALIVATPTTSALLVAPVQHVVLDVESTERAA